MFRWWRRVTAAQGRGFTLVELVVVMAILGILVAMAVPRYLAVRKKAYKAEADNILQEVKTLEWAYYQQNGSFDATGAKLGFVMPEGSHWSAPTISGSDTSIQMTMSGAKNPLSAADSVWITLAADGSSSGGSTF